MDMLYAYVATALDCNFLLFFFVLVVQAGTQRTLYPDSEACDWSQAQRKVISIIVLIKYIAN